MNTLPRQDTAKIYSFPYRVRAAALEAQRSERNGPARFVATCDHGSGWYHEAAIQEDARTRKP